MNGVVGRSVDAIENLSHRCGLDGVTSLGTSPMTLYVVRLARVNANGSVDARH